MHLTQVFAINFPTLLTGDRVAAEYQDLSSEDDKMSVKFIGNKTQQNERLVKYPIHPSHSVERTFLIRGFHSDKLTFSTHH
eukprot:11730868-Ditylum_brightwellii.AAC.1